jgi:hypothetical protein
MTSRTVYVFIEGTLAGAFPLSILNEDAEKLFSWLPSRLGRDDSGVFSGLPVQHFRTTSGDIIPWTDDVASYLKNNTKENPIVMVVRDAAPVVHAIPVAVQESLAVLANAIRSRSNFACSTALNTAAAKGIAAHVMRGSV